MLQKLISTLQNVSRLEKLLKAQHYVQTLALPRYQRKGALLPHGYQVFSQADEDGFIAEIFRRIGTKSKFFVEIAAGEGMENNTRHLLLQGWQGVWVEADSRNFTQIQENAGQWLKKGDLRALESHVTAENVVKLLEKAGVSKHFNLLSLDIDGNEYWLWQAIHQGGFLPEVVVTEYNANLGPDLEWVHPYQAGFRWDGKTINFGASLAALTRLAEQQGFLLIGCNYTGANAFFVQKKWAKHFAAPFTPQHHFEPPRYGGWVQFGYQKSALHSGEI